MATTEKAKKAAKPKKGGKGKKKSKKNSSMNFFSKIMLTLLFISIIAIAALLIAGNFKTDNKDKPKTELSLESKKELKTEKKSKTEAKEDVKEETSAKELQKENKKEEPKKETAKTETEIKKQETKPQKSKSKPESESKSLSGSWLSSEQGASLTLDEYGYRIDFFGVDASKPMTGNYTIDRNLIVFTSDDNDCKDSGTYRITFYKNNFSLIAKDDECAKRRSILEADWEWIEI